MSQIVMQYIPGSRPRRQNGAIFVRMLMFFYPTSQYITYDCIWCEILFAVLTELKRMQERISMIEAKLARNTQSAQPPSSLEHSRPVTQTSTASVTGQACASQSQQAQKPSLSQTSPTDCSSSSCSQSAPKPKACEKPGAIIIVSLVNGH